MSLARYFPTACVAMELLAISASTPATAAPVLPDFNAAAFVPGASVNHPYFPLINGRVRVYEGSGEQNGEPFTERFILTDLVNAGPVILGVRTSVQRDQSFENGLLVEDTRDFYAQDTSGNVWYMGEDVTNFVYDDADNLIETNSEGQWRAGVNGALPGFIMPANLDIGFNYYQEFAPADEAVDQATTSARGLSLTVPFGMFDDVLRVLETTELEPDAREFKFYAPGFGLIAAFEGLDESLANPELRVELIAVSQVPEPAALGLFGLGLLGVAAGRCSSRRLGNRQSRQRA